MGVNLSLAPIFLILSLSSLITMEFVSRSPEQLELIKKIEDSIPEHGWSIVRKAVSERLAESLSVIELLSLVDYVLLNLFENDTNLIIPMFIDHYGEEYVIKAIDELKLDRHTPEEWSNTYD